MSQVFFVGDLHLGHRAVLKHSAERRAVVGEHASIEQHDAWVVSRLLSVKPSKRTLWYILGDVAMEESRLALLDSIPGRKILVAGNHDLFNTISYLRYFEQVTGGFRKYGMWITHIPVHPAELRGSPNVHGHTHENNLVGDPRYCNVSIEWAPNMQPVTLEYLRQRFAAYMPVTHTHTQRSLNL